MEIPIISPKKAIKSFIYLGYKEVRQRGSHVRLIHSNKIIHKPITIPDHGKNIKPLLLIKIIKDAGLNLTEFKEILNKI